jgi:gliding motility-associated-like protein
VYVSSTATLVRIIVQLEFGQLEVLANGASETLTITATVIADGNYVNNALVQGNETDPNFSNNFSSVETFPTDFNIPEGFSPNGDGINDLFVIRGIMRFSKNEFTIFNRWGNKVFEASPYKNEWDGKADMGIRVGGDDLPVGTYFYIT